jgi:hypothetical protein
MLFAECNRPLNLICNIICLQGDVRYVYYYVRCVQKPEVLTTCGLSENKNNIYLNIRDLTSITDGQYIPAKSGQEHWLFYLIKTKFEY